MSQRSIIYRDCGSKLRDKKVTIRDSALDELFPNIIQCEDIHEHLESLLDSTLYALECGSSIENGCKIIERIFAINPLVITSHSSITALMKLLHKNIKEEQALHVSSIFRCLGWSLCFLSTYNSEFVDCSIQVNELFTILTTLLETKTTLYFPYALNFMAGLTCLYLSLPPPYRTGWGYDRYIPLALFFLTKNYNLEIAPKLFATAINGILLATKFHSDPKIVPLYPEEIVSTYASSFTTNSDDDDGYYLPLNDDGDDSQLSIPITEWSFDKLLVRIESIFDGETLVLENEYPQDDLDMYNDTIQNDFMNIKTQLHSKEDREKLRHKLDDGWSTSLTEDIHAPPLATDLVLPEFDNRNHPLAKHCPSHYQSFEGRAMYFSLDIFNLLWDTVLNWSYIGDLLSSEKIQERIDNEISAATRKEFAPTDAYERRMGKKEQDIFIKHGRDAKLNATYDHVNNEIGE